MITSLHANLNTRAGRMLAAGDVRVTVTSKDSGQHITIRFKAFAKNEGPGKRWIRVPLEEASHVFVEVPNASGEWSDKVGTFYPKSGRWYNANTATFPRMWAAEHAARWLSGMPTSSKATFLEESRCGKCARELTDPVSIERGLGPHCYGEETGSQHQVKHPNFKEAVEMPPKEFQQRKNAATRDNDLGQLRLGSITMLGR